jgi:hypothetical protein
VAGRSRTCGAPRFRRPLYRAELRPLDWGHLIGATCDGRGWTRTSNLLLVKQALSAIEPLALGGAPGQGVEPRSPRSERGVLPVRRSRIAGPGSRGPDRRACRPRPPSTSHGEVDAAAQAAAMRCRAMTRSPATERCCSSHSPTLRPWIAGIRRPTWRSFGARRSCVSGECAGKSRSLFSSEFCCAENAEEPFSLRRGLEFRFGISAEHHLSESEFQWRYTKRATPWGRPRLQRLCG